MTARKTPAKRVAAKDVKAKVPKANNKTKMKSVAERAAAVEKNLGESQPLRDFLNGVGWR